MPREKQSDKMIMDPPGNHDTIAGPDIIHSTDHLKTFVMTFCDRQATDLVAMIRSSIELFKYCIPSREAILVFYSELFAEYSTYYWILKKRSLTTATQPEISCNKDQKSQSNKGKIEYVGELTRRFHQAAKLKQADEHDQKSDAGTISPRIQSPTKSIYTSILTGPASPTGSAQACTSPTSKMSFRHNEPKVIPVHRRTSSCNSASENMDQTPMSPSAQESAEDVAEPDEEDQDSDDHSIDIFSELEGLIAEIKSSLTHLIMKHSDRNVPGVFVERSHNNKENDRLRTTISEWATEHLATLNSRWQSVSHEIATEFNKVAPTSLLNRQIDLCMANPVNKLLVDLLLESSCNFESLFGRMMSSSNNCDWLLAHILLEMSKRPDCDQNFAKSMEFMIERQSNINSLTYILAYLSDNNPKAMTNFPKSNIPFLISLCQSSISLLNVLALEIPDEISPSFLNNLATDIYSKVHSKGHPNCIESLTHCVVAAPNTYKLFLLAFDAVLSDKVSQQVKSAAQVVIDSIVMRIHERATQGLTPQTTMLPNPQLHLVDGLLNQINNDLSKLIDKSSRSKYENKKANAIFYRMSLIFGHMFASKVICHYLNLPEEDFWSLLKPILHKFMENFGDDGSTLVSQTLSIDSVRKPVYWVNMNTLVTKCPDLKLDLDLISQLMSDKLCAATFDINSTSQLIKLCCSSLQRVDQARIRISTKHRLCKALATCYFLLLENETDDFTNVLSHIKVSLTCMYLLKQSTVASHILCRALLERSLVYGHLFNKSFNPSMIIDGLETNDWTYEEASMKLSRENLKVSLGHRFRRLPFHGRAISSTDQKIDLKGSTAGANGSKKDNHFGEKPDRQSINSYLLIEAFRSSINNIEAFANLFVEFHCPVMFDKHLWPNDEALRVINEKNLAILRKFEQVPPLWDLFEFIGENKCLKNCLVLVKALLAAHLALWASATTNSCPDKMGSTSRLIPPLSRSGLIPRAFGLTVDVFQHLSPSEVFSVLSDIWQYLKDTNLSYGQTDTESTTEEERAKAKAYLDRLRLYMCQHMPGPTYVKIFKDFYKPAPKTIPS